MPDPIGKSRNIKERPATAPRQPSIMPESAESQQRRQRIFSGHRRRNNHMGARTIRIRIGPRNGQDRPSGGNDVFGHHRWCPADGGGTGPQSRMVRRSAVLIFGSKGFLRRRPSTEPGPPLPSIPPSQPARLSGSERAATPRTTISSVPSTKTACTIRLSAPTKCAACWFRNPVPLA